MISMNIFSQNDRTEVVLFAVRYLSTFLLFTIGWLAPGISYSELKYVSLNTETLY